MPNMPSHREEWSGHVPPGLSYLADGTYDHELAAKGSPYQAGVPQAIAAALRHGGADMSFGDFVSISGWATGFAYQYGTDEPGFMAIRGQSEARGKWQVFRIVDWFGFGYEACPTAEKDELWDFVREYVGAGVPVISEHVDGGLIVGYRERDGKREVWFQGDPGFGWNDINDLHPFEVAVLVEQGAALPKRELCSRATERMAHYALLGPQGEMLCGLDALESYSRDVADGSKDFESCREYFCWATFNRLDTRRCVAAWLDAFADASHGHLGLSRSRDLYAESADLYCQYRLAVGGGLPNAQIDPRSPEVIDEGSPLLQRAIGIERDALEELVRAGG